MRMSTMFGRTLRQAPAEAETESHKLILRAGLARQHAAGIYSYLPLGWRVIKKIEQILRDEFDATGGQELLAPVLNPAELWQESRRYDEYGPVLLKLEDRGERQFVLCPTHEEPVTDLARREIDSYRQLPFHVYQIQTKMRDEPRPRGGMMRLREFLMIDGYSFHTGLDDIDRYYPVIFQAYLNIFKRCGLSIIPVEADSGAMGGSASHEFAALSENGEDWVALNEQTGYAANLEKAIFDKTIPGYTPAPPSSNAPQAVATPGVESIERLERFFGLPAYRFLKTVLYVDQNGPVLAAIRGDLQVNEVKLANLLGSLDLRLADEATFTQLGSVPGFISPVGLPSGVRVVADDSVTMMGTLEWIVGANKKDLHLTGVVYGRDFCADKVADIALAYSGAPGIDGGRLELRRAIEMGHTFKLGNRYTQALHATYRGEDGEEHLPVMGCYGIGIDRLMSTIIEQHHDERGIVWPVSVAPYMIHLVALNTDDAAAFAAAEQLYLRLTQAGFEVLYDDRSDATPGVKFNDADLIGIPVRVTISKRTLNQQSVEVKPRHAKTFDLLPLDGRTLEDRLNALLVEAKDG